MKHEQHLRVHGTTLASLLHSAVSGQRYCDGLIYGARAVCSGTCAQPNDPASCSRTHGSACAQDIPSRRTRNTSAMTTVGARPAAVLPPPPAACMLIALLPPAQRP
jgi:hypothetical protein